MIERLFCHSAEAYRAETDAWGRETETLIASLPRVRLEPSAEVVRDNGSDVRCSARMYLTERVLQTGDIVYSGGRRYRVRKVTECFGRSAYHHTEAELSDG